MGCEQILAKELRDRGLRMTPQREMVLAALHELDGHASVEETYQAVREHSAAVDKTTVYRTLELLRDLGFVHEVEVGDSVLRYELALHGEHGHLLCTSCGRLVTFDCDCLANLKTKLASAYGFSMETEHQVLRGLCAECARRRASDVAVEAL